MTEKKSILQCPMAKLENLLVATDGTPFSEGAIQESITLAKLCSAKIFVISVVVTNREFMVQAPDLEEKAEKMVTEYLKLIKKKASEEGIDCETIFHIGEEPYEFIVDEAAKRKVDMIITGRQGRTWIHKLMVGNVVSRVIGHSPCNILIVPLGAKIKFNNILIAIDGSQYSNVAASQAIHIAKNSGANLIAISVVSSELLYPLNIVQSEKQREPIAEEELKEAEKNITYVKELAEKEGLHVHGFIYAGKPYDAIIDIAKKKDVDIIVLGCHGKTGLEKLLMGSVVERVVILSPCAVLVIKMPQ